MMDSRSAPGDSGDRSRGDETKKLCAHGIHGAIEKPKHGRSRDLSTDLYARILVAEKEVRSMGLVYEDGYFLQDLSKGDEDTNFMHVYLMSIGDPDDTEKKPPKRKTLTAYAGASEDAPISRVAGHNDGSAELKNPKTRDGIPRWTLCVIMYIPRKLRDHVTTKLFKDYLGMAHGIRGKLTRFFRIIKMFNLRFYIPPERELFVGQFVRTKCEIDNSPDLFKSPAILQSEQDARARDNDSDKTSQTDEQPSSRKRQQNP